MAKLFGEDDSLEIDTPNGTISVLRPGFYRVDVNGTGETSTVTVRHGEAEGQEHEREEVRKRQETERQQQRKKGSDDTKGSDNKKRG